MSTTYYRESHLGPSMRFDECPAGPFVWNSGVAGYYVLGIKNAPGLLGSRFGVVASTGERFWADAGDTDELANVAVRPVVVELGPYREYLPAEAITRASEAFAGDSLAPSPTAARRNFAAGIHFAQGDGMPEPTYDPAARLNPTDAAVDAAAIALIGAGTDDERTEARIYFRAGAHFGMGRGLDYKAAMALGIGKALGVEVSAVKNTEAPVPDRSILEQIALDVAAEVASHAPFRYSDMDHERRDALSDRDAAAFDMGRLRQQLADARGSYLDAERRAERLRCVELLVGAFCVGPSPCWAPVVTSECIQQTGPSPRREEVSLPDLLARIRDGAWE